MIDLQELKSRVDLLALAGKDTALRRVASSGGGEWAGPCPFCGGRDRFRLQPQSPGGGRWLCRGCTEGKWQDAIAYGQRLWPGLAFGEVCERLAGGSLPQTNAHSHYQASSEHRTAPAYQAPGDNWQTLGRQAVEICERNLWAGVGERALGYLRGRGLRDETIRYWRLGYSPGLKISPHPLPPLPEGRGENRGEGGLYIPRGALIPCLELDQVWYLKVSLLPGERVKCERCGERAPARQPCSKCSAVNKYRGVKGNRTGAIYGADELRGADLALFVEGEFDALVAWQELRDVIAVCTLGSAANRPDLATWGAYLAPLERIYALYDADRAGQAGLKALQELSERARPVRLPEGVKDVNEFVLAGGDLWGWLKGVING